MGQMRGDEGLPAFFGLLARAGRGGKLVFLEPVFREDPVEAGMAQKDRHRALAFQLLRDADAIQRRTETGLGKQGDDGLGHAMPARASGRMPRLAVCGLRIWLRRRCSTIWSAAS